MSDVMQSIALAQGIAAASATAGLSSIPADTIISATGTGYRPTGLPTLHLMPAHHGCMTQAVQLTDEEQLCVMDRLIELVEEKPAEWEFRDSFARLPKQEISLHLGLYPNILVWCGSRQMLASCNGIEAVKARSAILFDKLHEVRHRYARHEAVMQLEKALEFNIQDRLAKLKASEAKAEVEKGQAKRVEEMKRQVEAITGPEPNAPRQKLLTKALNVVVLILGTFLSAAAVTKAIAG